MLPVRTSGSRVQNSTRKTQSRRCHHAQCTCTNSCNNCYSAYLPGVQGKGCIVVLPWKHYPIEYPCYPWKTTRTRYPKKMLPDSALVLVLKITITNGECSCYPHAGRRRRLLIVRRKSKEPIPLDLFLTCRWHQNSSNTVIFKYLFNLVPYDFICMLLLTTPQALLPSKNIWMHLCSLPAYLKIDAETFSLPLQDLLSSFPNVGGCIFGEFIVTIQKMRESTGQWVRGRDRDTLIWRVARPTLYAPTV